MKIAIRLFPLSPAGITIVAWTSVDDSMSMQLHFEYQKF
jgi:hypothetical protein